MTKETPDIFLSYNRENQATAKRFAEAFEVAGFSVWWDVTLRSGEAYDQVTEEALKSARAVVVLWSKKSVDSRWVRAEATVADRNRTLVPVRIEPCDLPVMFELTQTAELSHWQGNSGDPAWRALVADVKRLIEKDAQPGDLVQPEVRSTAPPVNGLSIAVLPFANMSGDPEQEYFADGIAEEILNTLARISQLQVRGRLSSFYFKGRNEDLKSIAAQLNVDHILVGSVRKSGDKVRITVQLVNVTTDVHIWSKTYDRVLDDIFAIQEDIAASVASTLEVSLGIGELGNEPGMTRDIRAYELFLEAREQFGYADRDHYQRSIDLLEQAVKIDPQFALVWAELANMYSGAARYFMTDQVNRYRDRAEAAFARAEQLAPDSWSVLLYKAQKLQAQNHWQQAGELIQRLTATKSQYQIASQNLSAFSLGFFAADLGHTSEAMAYFQTAAMAEPLHQLPVLVGGAIHAMLGDYEAAQVAFDKAKRLPVGNLSVVYNAEVTLAMARNDRAALERALQQFLNHSHYSVMGKAAGKVASAMEQLLYSPQVALETLRRFAESPDYQMPMLRSNQMSHWAAYLGDPQLALDLQYTGGKPAVVNPATLWHPNLADMRRLPCFKRLVIDLGLVDCWRATGNWGDFCRPVGENEFECR